MWDRKQSRVTYPGRVNERKSVDRIQIFVRLSLNHNRAYATQALYTEPIHYLSTWRHNRRNTWHLPLPHVCATDLSNENNNTCIYFIRDTLYINQPLTERIRYTRQRILLLLVNVWVTWRTPLINAIFHVTPKPVYSFAGTLATTHYGIATL